MTRPRSIGFRWLTALVLGFVLASGACAPRTPPVTTPRPAPAPSAAQDGRPVPAQPVVAPPTPVERLRGSLDTDFGASAFNRMQWAVLVQSLATGETLYSENPSKLMMPASNMKIVTLAAAAERLGWDFTYETRLVTSAPIVGGVLNGDLIVVGSGDPTIGSRGGQPTRVFEAWADQLRADGITAIRGRIVADTRAFDRESLGAGWAWDYLAAYYAAGVSALQFNESVADVAVRPGPSPGTPAVIEVRPIESGLILDKQVTTVAGGEADIDLARLPGSNRLIVRGTIPVGSGEAVRAASVDRPALYFARMLRVTLLAKGIRVTGEAGEFEDVYPTPPTEPVRVLVSHRSAPLAEIARVQMKVSQNQYAETLLRTLGAQTGEGTATAGQKVVRNVLDGWGIPDDAYVLADGSGLSRYNYVCAEMLVKILAHVYGDPRLRDPFMATLPVGGQDGTLARRFVGTRAAGNVRAKTGSIANVRSLSGYVTSADGEPFVFSIIANHFNVPQAEIDAAADLAVVRLAEFSRSAAAPDPAREPER
jgi:D-alanyl-D-alanine carboxypeptidase/D-alanyl-D-alanine-endopeptidase (penicillin-binding protein 4)